jgi:ribonucleotide reductase beta subunit family protein with ferritin-like domain
MSVFKNEGSDRYTVFPIKFPKLWEFYQQQLSVFWTVAEVKLTDDITDWNNKLNDNEKFFIKNILAFFAASDGIVNENLVVNFYNEVQIPEARSFYAAQMMIESIHCVAPETNILTDKGYFQIKKLKNEEVNVWNGYEFSKVKVLKTSDKDKLYKVVLSNGMELECTSQHKWHIRHGNQKHPENCKNIIKHTEDLKKDDIIITKWSYPSIDTPDQDEFLNPYTHGFFCGDGSFSNGYPTLYLYGDKIKLLDHLSVSSNKDGRIQKGIPQKRVQCYLTNTINKDKYVVPINYSKETKLRWLEGYVDADGCCNYNSKKTSLCLQIVSINKKFLNDVQLMLSTLGVDSNIKVNNKEGYRLLPSHNDTNEYKEYLCKTSYVLYISCYNTKQLYNMGFRPKRVILHTIDQNIKQNKSLIRVVDIIDNNREDETYCFNEPKNHTGIFNGILTGQSEQYSLLIDTYIIDRKEKDILFNAVENIPCVKKKANWALKWIEEGSSTVETLPEHVKSGLGALSNKTDLTDEMKAALHFFTKSRPSFGQRLLAFVCVEGIFFAGSFCAIYWLKNRGLMPGLSTANEFISRDENTHTEFAIELYKLLDERVDESTVHAIFKEAVDIEKEFVTESLPVSLIGMNCTLMKEYIEYIADRWLILLGYSKIYNTKNPFTFMEMIGLNSKSNFFEVLNSSYLRANSGASEEERQITFDSDDF